VKTGERGGGERQREEVGKKDEERARTHMNLFFRFQTHCFFFKFLYSFTSGSCTLSHTHSQTHKLQMVFDRYRSPNDLVQFDKLPEFIKELYEANQRQLRSLFLSVSVSFSVSVSPLCLCLHLLLTDS